MEVALKNRSWYFYAGPVYTRDSNSVITIPADDLATGYYKEAYYTRSQESTTHEKCTCIKNAVASMSTDFMYAACIVITVLCRLVYDKPYQYKSFNLEETSR